LLFVVSLVLVPVEDLLGPSDGIGDAYPRWLRLDPEFEVVSSIVMAHTISMVHGFIRQKEPPKQPFHDEDVFEHVLPTSRGGAGVARLEDHHVAGMVLRPAAFPVMVLHALLTSL
jgi:hypothetical protein